MKQSFKLMLILALGAGTFTLNSCSDEPEEEPTPAVITCYLTQEVATDEDGTSTTTYAYNSDNQLVTATEDDDVTTFEYSGGRVATVVNGLEESTFIYTAASNIPERINVKYDGINDGFMIIESGVNGITKVEEHGYDEDENAVLQYVTNFTYTNGVLTGAKSESYNSEDDEFETDLEIINIVLDGKKNPYNGDVAFLFVNDFSPLAGSKSNIVSADLVTELGNFPYSTTYTYNENNYPTIAKATVLTFSTSINFTYTCK